MAERSERSQVTVTRTEAWGKVAEEEGMGEGRGGCEHYHDHDHDGNENLPVVGNVPGEGGGEDDPSTARRWNRLADGMRRFHEWFKLEFDTVYELADGSYTTRGMSFGTYLASVQLFRRHLTAHHTIEEHHIFPILARRMPAFREEDAHVRSHHAIHQGLDKLGDLLERYDADPTTYAPTELRECLDSWREVLFGHLDEEVEDLSGVNMKKYWTLEELDRIPL